MKTGVGVKGLFEADVAIIGGGITGAAIAHNLSRYRAKTILLEKSGELAAGQSKATLGNIYTGLNMVGSMVLKSVMMPLGSRLEEAHDPNKLLTKWSEEGFEDWGRTLRELGIRHCYMPLLVVAKDADQVEDLQRYIKIGRGFGGIYSDFVQLDRDQILELEPNLCKDILTGLYAKNHIIDIFPPEVVMAMAENAAQNGVRVLVNAGVTGIKANADYFVLDTPAGKVETRYVVNAAGGWADLVADMVGGRDWGLTYNKTQFVILDRRAKGLVRSMVRYPNKPGMLQVVQPRGDNILIECGRYDPTDNPKDTGSVREKVIEAISIAKSLVPAVSENDVISTFMGVRVFNTRDVGDHIVEPSPANPRFINVVIRLPGIIGALPMARYVTDLVGNAGLALVAKQGYQPCRKAISKVGGMNDADLAELTRLDPGYGKVICNCEKITEGEIIEAVNRGTSTLTAVKFLTRATMGRCQGNFCRTKVEEILEKELKKMTAGVPRALPLDRTLGRCPPGMDGN